MTWQSFCHIRQLIWGWFDAIPMFSIVRELGALYNLEISSNRKEWNNQRNWSRKMQFWIPLLDMDSHRVRDMDTCKCLVPSHRTFATLDNNWMLYIGHANLWTKIIYFYHETLKKIQQWWFTETKISFTSLTLIKC